MWTNPLGIKSSILIIHQQYVQWYYTTQPLHYLEMFPQYHPWSARARSAFGGGSGGRLDLASGSSMMAEGWVYDGRETEGWGGKGVETGREVRGAGGKIVRFTLVANAGYYM